MAVPLFTGFDAIFLCPICGLRIARFIPTVVFIRAKYGK